MNLQRTAAYISNVRRRRWRNGRFSAAGQYLGVEEHNGLAIDFAADNAIVVRNREATFLGRPQDLLTVTRASGASYFDSSGILRQASNNILRLDHHPVTKVPLGALIEEQRTNLLLRSAEFDNASWTKSNSPNVTANAFAAPDGTTSAETIEDASAGATSSVNQATSKTSGVALVASLFVRKDAVPQATRYVVMRLNYSGGTQKAGDVRLDTSTGEILYASAVGSAVGSATVQDCGDYWRISVTVTDDGANTTATFFFFPAAGAGVLANAYTAATLGSASIWGAQLEVGAFPTSYIPTGSAQVTRAADTVTLATSAFPYNQPAGTIVAEMVQGLDTNMHLINLNNGTASERAVIFENGNLNFRVDDGGASQGNIVKTISASNTLFKVAVGFAVNDLAFSKNGDAPGTDSVANIPTPTKLTIGADEAGTGLHANAWFKRLKYLPRRASDAELQSMSA